MIVWWGPKKQEPYYSQTVFEWNTWDLGFRIKSSNLHIDKLKPHFPPKIFSATDFPNQLRCIATLLAGHLSLLLLVWLLTSFQILHLFFCCCCCFFLFPNPAIIQVHTHFVKLRLALHGPLAWPNCVGWSILHAANKDCGKCLKLLLRA